MLESIWKHLSNPSCMEIYKLFILLGMLVVGASQLIRLIKQIKEDNVWKRKEKALHFSKLYHNTYTEAKGKIEKAFGHGDSLIRRPVLIISNDEISEAIRANKITHSDLTEFLSYYENIGLAVKHNIADFEVIQDLMGTTYYKTYKLFQHYIEDAQKRNEKLWENIKYLAERIEKNGALIRNSVLVVSDDVVISSYINANKPFKKNNFNKSYENFVLEGEKQGVDILIVSDKDFSGLEIKYAWTFKDKKWCKVRNIDPVLIFDKFQSITVKSKKLKESIVSKGIPIINSPNFSDILQDKFETANTLKEEMIPTTTLSGNISLVSEIEKFAKKCIHPDMSKTKFVAKPKDGYGGKGITIINLEKDSNVDIGNNYVIQPFLDTSKGIPELNVKGYHDLRVIILNGEPIMSYIRSPLDGEFVSNTGQLEYVDLEKLPDSVKDICKKVDGKFKDNNPRFYSIDIGMGESGTPWVFELNAKPGIVWNTDSKLDIENTKKLHVKIVEVIKNEIWKWNTDSELDIESTKKLHAKIVEVIKIKYVSSANR